MKILVCISHVPDTTTKINFCDQNKHFDKTNVQFVINPNDDFGLTRAIWFQEKVGAKVTVIHVGGSETEPTLRKALAIGADDAIRIDSSPRDGLFVAKQIAQVIKNREFDLIITGHESIDYNGGVVHGALASLLSYNFVNHCIGLEVQGQEATAVRETENGQETISTKLPLVIGAKKGLVEEKDLKIPNMRGIISARQKTLEVIEASAEVSSKSAVKGFEKPLPKESIKMISEDKLDELVDIIEGELKVI